MMSFGEKTYDEFRHAQLEGRVVLNIMPASWSWLRDFVPKRRFGSLFASAEERLKARIYNDQAVFEEVQRRGVDIGFLPRK